MKLKKIFVTGIGTNIGKTITSAIIVEALKADYFKPIQAGDLDNTDTDKVKSLVSNQVTNFHPSSYSLKTPMSPHAAATIDGVKININDIKWPETSNNLIIEGAGGLLVPLNNEDMILDLIDLDFHVVVVSQHYLGSINHSLLTLSLLKEKGYKTSLVFNGEKHQSTEDIIELKSNIPVIGRIDKEPYFDRNVVKEYADQFRSKLEEI